MVKVLDFNDLAPSHLPTMGSRHTRDLGSFMFGSYQTRSWKDGGFIQVPFVPKIMHGWAPDVFLHQFSMKVAIQPLQCWCYQKKKSVLISN
jgi:hypothetical protein